MRKRIKQIVSTIIAIMLTCTIIGAGRILRSKESEKTAKADGTTEKIYMINPTIFAQTEDLSFVYDEADGKIKVHNGTEIIESKSEPRVYDMVCSNGILYVLMEVSGASVIKAYSTTEPNLMNEIPINASGTDTAFNFSNITTSTTLSAIEETESETKLYIPIADQIEIHPLTIQKVDNHLEASFSGAITYSQHTSGARPTETNDITSIAASKGTLSTTIIIATDEGLYTIAYDESNSYIWTKLTGTPAQRLTSKSINSAKILVSITSSAISQVQNLALGWNPTSLEISGSKDIQIDGNNIYVLSGSEIIKLSDENSDGTFETKTTFASNNFSHETELNVGITLQYGETNKTTTIREYPYSTTPQTSIETGKNFVILASNAITFNNYYYCLYTSGTKNYIGYIPKADTKLVQANALSIERETIIALKVTKYPSHIIDEFNTEIETLAQGKKILIKGNTAEIEIFGKKYFMVETESGKIGFVQRGQVSEPTQEKVVKIKTNASIKITTNIYSDANGKNEIGTIKKFTRIKLNEKLNPNKKYTKITYTNNDGKTITGYVKTTAIDPDTLTTFQIVGIVLCSVNIVLVGTIIILKRKLV